MSDISPIKLVVYKTIGVKMLRLCVCVCVCVFVANLVCFFWQSFATKTGCIRCGEVSREVEAMFRVPQKKGRRGGDLSWRASLDVHVIHILLLVR